MGPGPQLSPRAISPCCSNGARLQLLKAWPWAPPSWVHPQADVPIWPQPHPVPKEEADDQGRGQHQLPRTLAGLWDRPRLPGPDFPLQGIMAVPKEPLTPAVHWQITKNRAWKQISR